MKIVVIVLIVAILVALLSAVIGMNTGGKEGSDKMFKSLSIRIGLSVFLFILLMFSGYMGWIEPNNVSLNKAPISQLAPAIAPQVVK